MSCEPAHLRLSSCGASNLSTGSLCYSILRKEKIFSGWKFTIRLKSEEIDLRNPKKR